MEKGLRVLYLLKNFELGGIERSTINFAQFISKKVEYVGIIGQRGFYANNNLISNTIEINTNYKSFSNPFFFISNLFNVLKILKEKEINILHYHFRIHILYILFIKLIFPKIKIFYTHHSIYNDFLNYFICSDFYFAISETNKMDLLKKRFHYSRVNILFNGFVIPNSRNIDLDKKKLGFVGRFQKIKGIDLLIDTFIKNKLNEKGYELIIVGDGKIEEETLNIINSCDKIRFQKPTYQIEKIYNNIGIIIVPCRDINNAGEGLPNLVMLEAMSCGIPVIASRVKGINSLLIEGFNLLLFTPDDESDLLKKINLLSTDIELYKSISKNGYEFVKKYYSIDVVGKSLLEKYEEAINK